MARSPRTAALLSALWVGLGQWYLGQRLRALALIVLWGGGLVFNLVVFVVPFLIVAWVWGIYDTLGIARRLAAREHPLTEGPYRTCSACGELSPLDFQKCPSCGVRLEPLR